MNAPKGPAAPASGTDIPTFEELAADPEIAALLDFEPVPVKPRVNGWGADAQRAFIALLAITGSKTRAAAASNRAPAGIDRLLERDDAKAFRAAYDAALALFRRTHGRKLASSVAAARREGEARSHAGVHGEHWSGVEAPGQKLNEYGEYEDEDSLHRRGDEAMDSIRQKLLGCRRLYLEEISGSPGKRAAFEMLTELPIDWELAAQGLPQPDEPWRRTNQREPDMILTAESGWPWGDIGYASKGQMDSALPLFDKALEVARMMGGGLSEANALSTRGICVKYCGHDQGSEDDIVAGFEIFFSMVSDEDLATAGWASLRSGLLAKDLADAELHFDDARSHWAKVNRYDLIREWVPLPNVVRDYFSAAQQ